MGLHREKAFNMIRNEGFGPPAALHGSGTLEEDRRSLIVRQRSLPHEMFIHTGLRCLITPEIGRRT